MEQECLAQAHMEVAWVTTADLLGLSTTEVHTTASFLPSTLKALWAEGQQSQLVTQQNCDIKFTFSSSWMSAHWQVCLFSENGRGKQQHRHLLTLFQCYIYIYYRPCQFICIWMWTQNAYVKGFLCLAVKTCIKKSVFARTAEALA